MRILKFNESRNSEMNEIKQLCNDYLSYLIDDGFKIDVDFFGSNSFRSNTILIKVTNGFSFTIDEDFKNIFIPFLTILDERFEIKELSNVIGQIDEYPIIEISRLGKSRDLTLSQFDSNRTIEMVSSIKIYIE